MPALIIPARIPDTLGTVVDVPVVTGAGTVTPVSPFTRVEHLTKPQRDAYELGLCEPHERRVRLDVLTLSGDHERTFDMALMGGQVVASRPAADQVSRTLTINVVDDQQVLDFSPSSPGESVFFDRLLRVHDDRCIPGLGWVSATVITGVVVTFKRVGNDVELTVHGKERLAMGSLWTTITLHRGMHKVDAIRRLLEACGETEFDLPKLDAAFDFGTHVVGKGKSKHRMPETRSLDRFASPWAEAQKIARSMNRELYYDGRGICRLRTTPDRVSFRFTTGDDGSVLAQPPVEVDRDLTGFHNTWLVLGKKPKGSKPRAHAVVKIPHDHPLSAGSLGRSGQPRVLAEKIEDTSLRSDAECRRVGERRMADAIRNTVQASFSAAPIPHLEVGDLVELAVEGQAPVAFRLWEFTLPLDVGSDGAPNPMTVGSVRRVPRRRHGRG